MAASAGTVTLDLDANSVRLLRELQKSQRATERAATGMQKSMARSFDAISNSAKRAAVAVGGVFGARVLRGIADAGIQMQRLERGLKVATGSAEGAASEMAFLRSEVSRLGLDLQTAGQSFVSLSAAARGTALQGAQTREIFTAISEASRVMGLSAEQTSGALTAIEQTISKGKVSAEELRGQLGERLPGAFQIAARSIGKTTSELDDMLKKGQLLAEDLLPAMARELRETFGPEVAGVTNDAQAAVARLRTAILDLKVAIAESGVLSAMEQFAGGMAAILGDDQGFGRRAGAFEEPIEHLTRLRARLEAQIEGIRAGAGQHEGILGNLVSRFRGDPSLEMLENQLESVTKALETFKKAQLEILTGGSSAQELSEVFVVAAKRANDYEKTLETLNKRYQTTEERIADLRFILKRFGDDLSPEQHAMILAEIQDIWSGGLEEITIDAKRRVSQPIKKEFDEMAEASKRAAQNIQDAFAEFLFDPFENGIKGMLQSFLDAIRRMIANQAALQLFGFIRAAFKAPGDWRNSLEGLATGDALSQMFPGRASGGSVSAGSAYMVGERGPELFVPGASGMVLPNHKLAAAGGMSVTNYIDAREALDPARTAQLVDAAAEEGSRRAVGQMLSLRQTRGI